jgi:hypothetical protein
LGQFERMIHERVQGLNGSRRICTYALRHHCEHDRSDRQGSKTICSWAGKEAWRKREEIRAWTKQAGRRERQRSGPRPADEQEEVRFAAVGNTDRRFTPGLSSVTITHAVRGRPGRMGVDRHRQQSAAVEVHAVDLLIALDLAIDPALRQFERRLVQCNQRSPHSQSIADTST